MMKNYNESIAINHTPNSPNIPDDPYRILIIGGSGSGKTNVLLNLIKHQRPDIDKIYLYVKDPFESKYRLFLNGREKVGIESQGIRWLFTNNGAGENLEDYNPTKKRRVLIAFDDMIADMKSKKKKSSKVTELFLTGRKLNISFVFISQSYVKVPETIRLESVLN